MDLALRRAAAVAVCLLLAGASLGMRAVNSGTAVSQPPAPLAQPFAHNVTLGFGDSVSIGTNGTPCTTASTTQPYNGTKLAESVGWYWEPLTVYSLNQITFPLQSTPTLSADSYQMWKVTTAGTSLSSEPSWPASPTAGVTTITGGATWTYQGLSPYTPMTDAGAATLSLVPLTCPLVPGNPLIPPGSYPPVNIYGEDFTLDMANTWTFLARDAGYPDFVLHDIATGVGGGTIGSFNAGTVPYNYWKNFQLPAAQRLFDSGSGVLYEAVANGENDTTVGLGYESTLVALKTSLDTDVPAATGQANKPPMFVYQEVGSPIWAQSPALVGASVLQTIYDQAGKIWGTYPVYPFQYTSAQNFHFSAHGYQEMGEAFGHAAWSAYNNGAWNGAWTPLVPASGNTTGAYALSNANKTVTVTFSVQVAPLRFLSASYDGTVAEPHPGGGALPQWSGAQGFEATDLPSTVTSESLATTPITVTVSSNPGWSNGDVLQTGCGPWPISVSGTTVTFTGSSAGACATWKTYLDAGVGNLTVARVLTISSVSVVSGVKVAVTVSTVPGTGFRIAYAWTPDNWQLTNLSGMTVGTRYGFLRDSDPFVGPFSGIALPAAGWSFQSPALL